MAPETIPAHAKAGSKKEPEPVPAAKQGAAKEPAKIGPKAAPKAPSPPESIPPAPTSTRPAAASMPGEAAAIERERKVRGVKLWFEQEGVVAFV